MQDKLEAIRNNAIAFYRTAYLGDPAGAVEMYVGADYIQHNPLVGNGNSHLLIISLNWLPNIPASRLCLCARLPRVTWSPYTLIRAGQRVKNT